VLPRDRVPLACGPEPMLAAVRRISAGAQLALEAPMACGYGACYGCVVELDGQLKRLCVEGPVLGGRVPVPHTETRLAETAAAR
jgi:NAD(P)H-flavin reductase